MTKLGVRNTQTDPDRGKGKNYIQQEREKKNLREGVWATDPGRYRSVLPHSNNNCRR